MQAGDYTETHRGDTETEIEGTKRLRDPALRAVDVLESSLDSENERLIMDLLTHLNKENNQTFVIVTHSDYVGGRTDRIINMKDGEVV